MLILMIDDDPEDIDFFVETLKEVNRDCECLSAFSCEKGLENLTKMQHVPDFIFLDGMLFGISSKECLAKLKADQRLQDVRVVIYSGGLSPNLQQEFLRNGAHTYLQKPLNRQDLINGLKRILFTDERSK